MNAVEIAAVSRLAARRLSVLLAAILALAVLGAAPAGAATPEPHIRLTSLVPDHVTAGEGVLMFLGIHNDGSLPMSGPITIKITYPEGLPVVEPGGGDSPEPSCTQSGQVEECTLEAAGTPVGRELRYQLFAIVEPGASGVLSGQIEVAGGGASNTAATPFSLDTSPIGPFEISNLASFIRDAEGNATSKAGAHPASLETDGALLSQARTSFEFPIANTTDVSAPENMRDVITHVPVGLIGYPTATGARCTSTQLGTVSVVPGVQQPVCPRDSQIGTVLVDGKDITSLYNLVPPSGAPAEFGFYYQGIIVNLRTRLRPSDNGVDIVAEMVPSSTPITKFEVTIWGVPAAGAHDTERAECTQGLLVGAGGALCPSSAPHKPFLRLPTSCSGQPLPWSMEIDTYERPGAFHRKEATTPALEDCGALPFEPKLNTGTTTSAAHTPSGLNFEIAMPQEGSTPKPESLAEADLRSAKVTLPEGVGLNPAAAEGLTACSDAQLRLGLEGPSQCPDASKIGTVEVKTPLLEEAVGGSVYIRSQSSQDPESGQMYRLAIELRNEARGVYVKLPGSLRVNPATGRLTTNFEDLPQLPFESMRLHLNSGPHAPLTTPSACGTYAVESQLTSWARPNEPVVFSTPMKIDQGCSTPAFAPGFEAGVSNTTAGEFAPFTLRVTRAPGMANLSRITANLPEGELAKLAGVAVCTDQQAAAGACPTSSQIGRVVAAVGEGSNPLYLPQPGKAPTAVYLAAPYKGAPYSVIASVPAQSGPFDLGTVTVRSALNVDPRSTQVSVVSDPLPQIFGGIPVSYRDVRVEIDRPQFTINPTDCEPMAVTGLLAGTGGASAAVSHRFQVGDCASLGFKPTLSLALKGKTTRTGHPAVKAVLTYPSKGAYANIARAQVTLPGSEFLDQGNLNKVCTQPELKSKSCPAKSIYGHAKAWSPLLDRPLTGPVYLAVGFGYKLPALVAELDGQIRVLLVGKVDTGKDKGIRNTFEAVPDAPVSRFVLELKGGKRYGLLENSEDICRKTQKAEARFTAQNGAALTLKPKLKVSCPKAGRHAKKR